jgi:hypothetical protein
MTIPCPDICPICGSDLKYQGHPERHQDDSDGSECAYSWDADCEDN